jgi:hypothetical protein
MNVRDESLPSKPDDVSVVLYRRNELGQTKKG